MIDATELETTACALRESLFTRTILFAMTGLFALVGIETNVALAVFLGLIFGGCCIYWHLQEIPDKQRAYNLAHKRFMSTVWASRPPSSEE